MYCEHGIWTLCVVFSPLYFYLQHPKKVRKGAHHGPRPISQLNNHTINSNLLVHHYFSIWAAPILWMLIAQGIIHNILCVCDKGTTRTFVGYFLTPGRNILSAALYWLQHILRLQYTSLQNTAAALLHVGWNSQTWVTPDHTQVMTRKVVPFDFLWHTSAMASLIAIAHTTHNIYSLFLYIQKAHCFLKLHPHLWVKQMLNYIVRCIHIHGLWSQKTIWA